MKKSLFILLLHTALLSSAQSGETTSFAYSYKGNVLEYDVDEENMTSLVIDCISDEGGSLEIPSRVLSPNDNRWYTVNRIGECALQFSEITSVVIPNSVTRIDRDAFNGCPQLTSVTIGKSVGYIGHYCFTGCMKLRDVNITASTPPYALLAFASSSKTLKLNVMPGSLEDYSESEYWNEIKEINPLITAGKVEIEGNDVVLMNPDETIQLKASITPSDVSLPYIYWSSDNEEVASVTSDGLLTFHGFPANAEESESRSATASECKVTAETLFADGPVATVVIKDRNSGIENVFADKSTAVRIYEPSGVLVYDGEYSGAHLTSGVYIMVSGGTCKKLLIK